MQTLEIWNDQQTQLLMCELDEVLFLRDNFRMTLFAEGADFAMCGIEIKINGETFAKETVKLRGMEWFDYSELLRNAALSMRKEILQPFNDCYGREWYEVPFIIGSFRLDNFVVKFTLNEKEVEVAARKAIDSYSPQYYDFNEMVWDVECGVWPLDVWDRYGGVSLFSPDGNIAIRIGNKWCGYENCENTWVHFSAGENFFCLNADNAGECDIKPTWPTTHIAKVAITGVNPDDTACGGGNRSKVPMARVQYVRADGLSILRWAEVVDAGLSVNIEQENENRYGGIKYYTSENRYFRGMRAVYTRKIKLAWRKFPAAERKQIAVGIAQSPVITIEFNKELLIGRLTSQSDLAYGADGDLEVEFIVNSITTSICNNY